MRTLNEYFLTLELTDVSTLDGVAMCVVPDSGKIVRIDTVLYGPITVGDAILSPFIGAPIAVASVGEGDPVTDIEVTTGSVHGLKVGDTVVHWTDFANAAYEGPFTVTTIESTTAYQVTATWGATGTGTMCKTITLPTEGITVATASAPTAIAGYLAHSVG